ncbi:MAG: hypothetical protein ACRDP6_45620 [Actinoallomurus sp.]
MSISSPGRPRTALPRRGSDERFDPVWDPGRPDDARVRLDDDLQRDRAEEPSVERVDTGDMTSD